MFYRRGCGLLFWMDELLSHLWIHSCLGRCCDVLVSMVQGGNSRHRPLSPFLLCVHGYMGCALFGGENNQSLFVVVFLVVCVSQKGNVQ